MQLTQLRSNRKLFVPAIVLVIWSGLAPEVQAGMVGSLNVRELSSQRQTDMNAVLETLHEDQVTEHLTRVGLNTAEIERRILKMSDAELQRAASELERIRAGKGFEVLAVIGAMFFMLFVLSFVAVGRSPERESELLDLRTKKPTKRIYSPSSSKGY